MTNFRPEQPCYEFGSFLLNPSEHLLLRDGQPVALTPKAFAMLVMLVEQSGHVIEQHEFIDKLWSDACVEPNIVAVNIRTLRIALGLTPEGRQYIETVPRRGYRFNAAVREISCEHVKAHAGLAREARGESIDSLAVLPLVNASGDADAEYLADGITESIINTLARLPQLRVAARSTVFRYKGRDIDPQAAGRELNVRAVLSGRVLQFSDRLIIRVELIDVADGWQLWGEQYDSKPSDLLVVQEKIARQISEALQLKLSGAERQLLVKHPTKSSDAYETYLKGRYQWNKRTVEGLLKGIEFFEQASRIDPGFALAYAGLADSFLLLGSIEYGALDPEDAMEKAKEAATRALLLDSTLAEAHASLAYVQVFDWEWATADIEYRRAVELNPSYATAFHWYALYLTAMGREREGLEKILRAQALEPLSLPISLGVGFFYYLTRRYDEAIEEYRKAIELEPHFYMAHATLAMAYEMKEMFDEALEEYELAYKLSGGSPLLRFGVAHVYAVTGRHEEAYEVLEQLRRLKESSPDLHVSPYFMAPIYAALGDMDEAFRCLQQACEMRSEGLFWLQVDPMLDSMRDDPRFAELLRRVRLKP